MNIKVVSIALTVLLVAIAALVFMQKGNYIDQATEFYKAQSEKSFKGGEKILEYVNSSVDVNRLLWAMSCEALQDVKTSMDMAKLEAKYFPTTKGQNSIANKTRRFEATSAYYIVSSFAKVDEDKKTGLKTLSGLQSIDVNALVGNVAAAIPDEAEGEETDEEGSEE